MFCGEELATVNGFLHQQPKPFEKKAIKSLFSRIKLTSFPTDAHLFCLENVLAEIHLLH